LGSLDKKGCRAKHQEDATGDAAGADTLTCSVMLDGSPALTMKYDENHVIFLGARFFRATKIGESWSSYR